jgi:hypothetical protein
VPFGSSDTWSVTAAVWVTDINANIFMNARRAAIQHG